MKTDVEICHANIRSIRSNKTKLDHISCSLADEYDIITLSETWLNSTSEISHLLLKDFQSPFRKDRKNDDGYGGVLAWVSNNIAARRRTDFEINDIEAMWLEIHAKNKTFLLCTVYRPPNADNDFWTYLQESVDLAKESNITSIVIIGDLNADPHTQQGVQLKNFADTNSLILHITEPTRITEHSASILDQVMTNIPDYVKHIRVEPPVSTNDHCTIGISLSFKTYKKLAFKRLMWNFKVANFDKFREALCVGLIGLFSSCQILLMSLVKSSQVSY
jgi:exonuclease III